MLDEIVGHKKLELVGTKSDMSQNKLLELISDRKNAPLNFSGSLMGDRTRVIAEIKKKSFDGSIEDMSDVIDLVSKYRMPVIRKEFIVDQYQIYESRAYGADAILLIVSILGLKQLGDMLSLASSLWLQCLVEVHTEKELEIALDAGAEIIGINNRDLKTMTTSIETTEKLAPLIPSDKIIVSESGINSYSDVERVKDVGVNAVLVGESLVTATNPGKKLSGLV